MIRLQHKDQAEPENLQKMARKSVTESFILFCFTVGVIRAGESTRVRAAIGFRQTGTA